MLQLLVNTLTTQRLHWRNFFLTRTFICKATKEFTASESSDYQSRVFNQEITGVTSQEITGVTSQEIYWSGQSGKTKRVHVFIKAYSGRGEGLKG